MRSEDGGLRRQTEDKGGWELITMKNKRVGEVRQLIFEFVGGNHDEAPRRQAYLHVAPTWNGSQLKGDGQ